MKDDSGSYAVFTEQGSSASQMTAAKIMDIISRLPGCAGQAADAVSADTLVKMEDVPKITENSRIGMPRHLDSSTTTQMEVPCERNLYGHPLAGLLWERQFEKILLQHAWEKVSNWECLFVHREKGLFLSVYVDDIKLAGKKQNIDPMWKVRNKEVDLGEPTSFLDHVYLICTQRQCENKQRYCGQITEPCLNPEIPQVQPKKYHARKIFVFLSGPMTWKVMPRNVWNEIVS